MAVYATQEDIVEAIGQNMLTKIAALDAAGTIDSAAVDRTLSEASSLADTYLDAYLPLASTPDVLRRAVVNIAVQLLRVGQDKTTENSTLAYEMAIDWLTAVSTGKAALPAGDGGTATNTTTAPVLEAEERLYTRSTLGIF